MSENGTPTGAPETGESRVAVPLWGLGAAMFGWGLLRGRVFLMAVGAAAFFADGEAEPVRKVRAALDDLRDLR
jgi:hypothetical protein